ncbi:hypothetical protein M3Y98_00504300 [Aphelenchoides besseyi]|nr:hypothetical protein M3Y98_00504300 [Aphelenchoides besseyi]KAI6207787.1 hypothetical protein M3Y96_00045900 [Aphelenchoides besseyi]
MVIMTGTSSSSTSSDTTSFLDQHQPLLVCDRMERSKSPTRKDQRNSQYSMGGDVDETEKAVETKRDISDRCCCGVRVRIAAYWIAAIELVILAYNFGLAVWNFNKSSDDYYFSFVLGIFCMTLSFIAIVLLLIGIRKLSAYFLIPHMLMQFAMIVAWTLVAGYIVLLMIGGTSIKLNAVIYEDTPRGRLGLSSVDKYDPIRANVQFRGLNVILVVLLGLTVSIVAIQIWFFSIIAQYFSVLRSSSAKAAFNG